jgi:hypothetical protein
LPVDNSARIKYLNFNRQHLVEILSYSALKKGILINMELTGAPPQERLINWGYAVCDAALRKHVDPTLPAPDCFSYLHVGVG